MIWFIVVSIILGGYVIFLQYKLNDKVVIIRQKNDVIISRNAIIADAKDKLDDLERSLESTSTSLASTVKLLDLSVKHEMIKMDGYSGEHSYECGAMM